ncbi:RNA polymerase sigma-70 factor [Rhodocytophaga aerolata]|uniref:RNA polymerase sigma-70 factor n=1 Tax=Rhodocytophaga aerolata TaxID=455078 RepID=A0ABT8RHJ7_9BACT|nr:RNA polymerase sigma-70 factor [Rhodocytophaga aerolata]MDO1451196.1 RNA polymerase sigma-70 factor [Rhodocytophaga aerolata]
MYISIRSDSTPDGQPVHPLLTSVSMSDETLPVDGPDQEWIIRTTIKESPMQGCELLFRRYYSPLCSHAVRILYSQTIAEDLVADVFCDFWANRLFEQVNTSYRAYLFRMVRNRSINYLQRELHKQPSETVSENYIENSSVHPEQQLSVEELYQAIEQTVHSLPAQCKKVFLLSRYEGKRTHEIAEQMQISPRTVETHISKGLSTLRSNLTKMGFISFLLWLIS